MANKRRDRRLRALRRTTKLPERCFISRYVSFEPASNQRKDRNAVGAAVRCERQPMPLEFDLLGAVASRNGPSEAQVDLAVPEGTRKDTFANQAAPPALRLLSLGSFAGAC